MTLYDTHRNFTKSARAKIIAASINDALPFGPLWYGEPNAASNAVCYAKFSVARAML